MIDTHAPFIISTVIIIRSYARYSAVYHGDIRTCPVCGTIAYNAVTGACKSTVFNHNAGFLFRSRSVAVYKYRAQLSGNIAFHQAYCGICFVCAGIVDNINAAVKAFDIDLVKSKLCANGFDTFSGFVGSFNGSVKQGNRAFCLRFNCVLTRSRRYGVAAQVYGNIRSFRNRKSFAFQIDIGSKFYIYFFSCFKSFLQLCKVCNFFRRLCKGFRGKNKFRRVGKQRCVFPFRKQVVFCPVCQVAKVGIKLCCQFNFCIAAKIGIYSVAVLINIHRVIGAALVFQFVVYHCNSCIFISGIAVACKQLLQKIRNGGCAVHGFKFKGFFVKSGLIKIVFYGAQIFFDFHAYCCVSLIGFAVCYGNTGFAFFFSLLRSCKNVIAKHIIYPLPF